MMLSSATTRGREDESLSLPTATGHHGSDHNEFRYHKFFPFVGRPFTSLHLRSILRVGGLALLVFPLVLNLHTGESLLYQSQIGQSSLTVTADVDGDVGKIEESASANADAGNHQEIKQSNVAKNHSQQQTSEFEQCTKKYLLLTTQKSGSTWFCTVLHEQMGMSCGGKPGNLKTPVSELLIKYSFYNSSEMARVTWKQYKDDLDQAFAQVCEYNPATSIGFKLMYDQIPPKFIKDRRLQTYFENNGVNLIHLVREAKILVLASQHDVRERGFHHSTNSSSSKPQETSPLHWGEKDIEKMLAMENTSLWWQDQVHKMTPLVQNYYVSYEHLLGEDKRKHLVGQISGFVSGSYDRDARKANGVLLKQSESTCSSRITNYQAFRAHKKVINSRSAAACDLIDSVEKY